MTILLFFVTLAIIILPEDSLQSSDGVIHLGPIDNKAPIPLNGSWEYYPNEFLFSSDFTNTDFDNTNSAYASVPGTLPSPYGYGTYRLQFSFNSSENLFSLRLADIQGAARIYMDGVLVSDVGFTSSLEEIGESFRDNQYVVFPLDIMRKSHEIVIQVSNFSNYTSGISSPVYFGTQIEGYRLSSQFKFVESMGFISICIFALLLFFLRIFKIPLKNIQHLLTFTCAFAFQLVYSSNDLIVQPIESTAYMVLSRAMIFALGYLGYLLLMLASSNYAPTLWDKRILKVQNYIITISGLILAISPYYLLPHLYKIIIVYFLWCYAYSLCILFKKILLKSYTALMQALAQLFIGYYFVVLQLNSIGMISANVYTYSYIISILCFVTAYLAYIALHIAKIYTGNTRLAHHMLAADKLKGEFISATSHELRTPLHGIMNIIASCNNKTPESNCVKKELDLALRLARRMNSVIFDLYDFYSTNQRAETFLKPVNLETEVNAVIEMFHYTSKNDKIFLKNQLNPDALYVLADESRLWEVLNNLIGNAVKYTETGSITVKSQRKGSKIYISVIDTGIGISSNKLDSIFQNWTRTQDAKDMADGMGYGLYLVKQLVERMNGQIYVEWSKPNQGTCFTFYLDASESLSENEVANEPIMTANTQLMQENYLNHYYGNKASLLVVDDNEDNLKIIEDIFDDCRFDIDSVTNANIALDLLKKRTYDIIILDVMMPEISGFEMCQIVRKQFSHFELPILLLTARSSTESILTGFWSGANDYIVKPADRVELRTRVFNLISLRNSVKTTLSNELLFLQAQIRPHFLYNAFNTISAIALTNGEYASELIDDLSTYLRGCFRTDNETDFISIDKELLIVNAYVKIEKARFGNRLEFQLYSEIQSDFYLPALTIQPLVENAIRHNTLNSNKQIVVSLSLTEYDSYFHIVIQDNGNGIDSEKLTSLLNYELQDKNSGIGLSNVNRRLNLHYGKPIDIISNTEIGTKIIITIPKLNSYSEEIKNEL